MNERTNEKRFQTQRVDRQFLGSNCTATCSVILHNIQFTINLQSNSKIRTLTLQLSACCTKSKLISINVIIQHVVWKHLTNMFVRIVYTK